MTMKNEIWVLARVEADGAVKLSIPTDPSDPSATTPVSGSAVLSINGPAGPLSVRVRLRVRSSSGNCVPQWTPICPEMDSIGEALSKPLSVPGTGSLQYQIALQVGHASTRLDLELARTAGGIDIVLRPPPVEPPVPACGTTALAVVPRVAANVGTSGTGLTWH